MGRESPSVPVSPRTLVWLGVAIVVVVVVYAASPTIGSLFGQVGPVNVTINNSANQTYTFEVSVVENPANVTLRRDDGLTETYRIGPGGRTHSSGEYHTWTAVELPDSARVHGRFTLTPGEEVDTSIDASPSDFAVVTVIYEDENRIVEWLSDRCEGDLVSIEIWMFDYGSGTSAYCRGGLF